MNTSDSASLVSVGIPVYNGAATIQVAVESVLSQTYGNLEITISDNCSTDETEEICRELASKDSRVRYVRQDSRLTALNNYRYVFEQSKGAHFMWAAHDDLRASNYVEVLRRHFQEVPNASIVFSDSVVFNDYNNPEDGMVTEFRCDTRGLGPRDRHRAQARSNCCQIYGLVNVAYLRKYQWLDIGVGPDHLLLHWLLCLGDFVYVPGTTIYYFRPTLAKTLEEFAALNWFRPLKPLPLVRFSWACAGLIRAESVRTGESTSQLSLAMFFYSLLYGGPKHWLYENAPKGLRRLWHSVAGNAMVE